MDRRRRRARSDDVKNSGRPAGNGAIRRRLTGCGAGFLLTSSLALCLAPVLNNVHAVQLTLFINPEHPPGDPLDARLAEHVEQVRVARASGYDGVTIGTHLSYGSAAWLPPFQTLLHLAPAAAGMSLSTRAHHLRG